MKLTKMSIIGVVMVLCVLITQTVMAADKDGRVAETELNADGSHTYYIYDGDEKREVTKEKYEVFTNKGNSKFLDDWKREIFEQTVSEYLAQGVRNFELNFNGVLYYFLNGKEVTEKEYEAGIIVHEYIPTQSLPLPDDLTLTENEKFYLNSINEMRKNANLPPLEINKGLMLPAKSTYIPDSDLSMVPYLMNFSKLYTYPSFSTYTVAPEVFFVATFPGSWTTKKLQDVINFKQEIEDWVTNPEMTTIGIGVVKNYFPDSAGDHWLVIYIAGDSLSSLYPMQSAQQTVESPQPTSASTTTVTFNNQPLQFDLPIINRDGRTYYPLRQLIEGIGGTVTWVGEMQKASGSLNGNEVNFFIGSNDYTVNGTPATMGAVPFNENGRTYIPIRFAAEGLGLTVEWDTQTQTIKLQ